MIRPSASSPSSLRLDAWQSRPVRLMLHYVRRHWRGHVVLVAAVLGAVACATGSQYAIKHLIDTVAATSVMTAAVWTAYAAMVALIVTDNVFWRVAGWTASRLFVRVSGDVRKDLFQHVTGHSPDYFVNRLPGALAGRVSSAANAFFTVESSFAWAVFPPIVSVIGSIIVVITVDVNMAIALVIAAAVLSLVINRLARRGAPLHHAYASESSRLEGELVDVIANMGVVRMFGATLQEQHRLGERVDRQMDAQLRSLRYMEKLRLIHAVATAILASLLLGAVLLLWSEGRATPGDIVLVSSAGFAVLHATRDLAVALVDLTQHMARLSESVSTLLEPHEMPDRPGAVPLQAPHGHGVTISLEAVRFAYPGRAPVLNDLDLHVAAGERVGLVGRSGAGKSTVLALLQRLYDVQGGRILVEGQDVRDVTQLSLRQSIGVVPQDISLFHRTLLENIRYGRPDATEEETLAAAEAAGCRDFIEALPEGFHTMVGDRGVKLSGGQRQRLAIARAFLKDAPLLILDEATSALDSESEQVIKRALDRLMRNRTVIAVAHRLSTLNTFDRIVVMDRGRVVDMGAPQALANRPGPYRDLLDHQHGGVLAD